ncbi:MAG: class I SAM-dependent methyltransferase [Patescibacteria group bacterium]
MRLIAGNKQKELSYEEFQKTIKKYSSIALDIGTGDGRFVYKSSIHNPNTLYMGIDPSEKQLQVYSKRAVRKKINNVLFIVGSIENFPINDDEIIDEIHITLPWGTLLESIAKPTKNTISKLSKLLKKDGKLEIIFGYTPEFEPSETKRLDLPVIGDGLIQDTIIPLFESCKLTLSICKELSKKELKEIETTWAKKLHFGKNRKIYYISFLKKL